MMSVKGNSMPKAKMMPKPRPSAKRKPMQKTPTLKMSNNPRKNQKELDRIPKLGGKRSQAHREA